jgi:hypothetical protein
MMGLLERISGFLIGCLTLLTLFVVGVVLFVPDAGRYLRVKSM